MVKTFLKFKTPKKLFYDDKQLPKIVEKFIKYVGHTPKEIYFGVGHAEGTFSCQRYLARHSIASKSPSHLFQSGLLDGITIHLYYNTGKNNNKGKGGVLLSIVAPKWSAKQGFYL